MLVTQLCPTLCDPMDYTVHELLQARILERVAVPFSGDLPNPGVEPRSPTLQVDSLRAESQGKAIFIKGPKSSIFRPPLMPRFSKPRGQFG